MIKHELERCKTHKRYIKWGIRDILENIEKAHISEDGREWVLMLNKLDHEVCGVYEIRDAYLVRVPKDESKPVYISLHSVYIETETGEILTDG